MTFATNAFCKANQSKRMVGCWNSSTHNSHCMTATWLAGATQTRLGEPHILPHDFMQDAFPITTIPIYPDLGLAHFMLAYTPGFGSGNLNSVQKSSNNNCLSNLPILTL